jgi:hypothetical protein
MLEEGKDIPVLMAEDKRGNCLSVRKTQLESRCVNPLMITNDREALLDYLFQRGKCSDSTLAPQSYIIPMDLNLPKMDCREDLRIMKALKNYWQEIAELTPLNGAFLL